LDNLRKIKSEGAVPLNELAEVLGARVDLLTEVGRSEFRRVVEGQDIRAVEGLVLPRSPERCWAIAERKQRKVYELLHRDIVIGLVRPERRNIGILLDQGKDVVGSPDGLAVVRLRRGKEGRFPVAWLFSVLRSERIRIQFWTESGGTSYGKLNLEQIRNVLIPRGTYRERQVAARRVEEWIKAASGYADAWSQVGVESDRRPIVNSPLTGLFDEDSEVLSA